MILTIESKWCRVAALDLADPDDLSGGTNDYAFIALDEGAFINAVTSLAETRAVPKLNDCLRARIASGYDGGLVIGRLDFDTEANEGIVWLEAGAPL